jgi:hypothetical protein
VNFNIPFFQSHKCLFVASSDPSTLTTTTTTVSTWTTFEEETTDAHEDVTTTTTFPSVDSDYVVQDSGKMAKMGK